MDKGFEVWESHGPDPSDIGQIMDPSSDQGKKRSLCLESREWDKQELDGKQQKQLGTTQIRDYKCLK